MDDGSAVTVRRRTDNNQELEVAMLLSVLSKLEQVNHLVMSTSCNNVNDPLTVKIASRWDGRFSESSAMMSWEAACTTNKTHISICVRDKVGRLVDWATSVFVALHDLCESCTTIWLPIIQMNKPLRGLDRTL